MLKIVIPPVKEQLWVESRQEFINVEFKGQTLQLEHSLVSLSKWESKHHKLFLDKNKKSTEEMIDYIRCMTLTQNVNPEAYNYLTQKNIADIQKYIDDPMTATTITETEHKASNGERVSSELIYYWMIALNIPSEYQKWHLNRLLMLIKVCNIKNSPPKKMSQRELLRRNRALNDSRLKHGKHRR